MLAAGAQCRAAGLCGGVCRMAALMQSNLSPDTRRLLGVSQVGTWCSERSSIAPCAGQAVISCRACTVSPCHAVLGQKVQLFMPCAPLSPSSLPCALCSAFLSRKGNPPGFGLAAISLSMARPCAA